MRPIGGAAISAPRSEPLDSCDIRARPAPNAHRREAHVRRAKPAIKRAVIQAGWRRHRRRQRPCRGDQARRPLHPAARAPTATIGGFGGLFDLKAAGFKDPVLVAANDGVGTKLRIAIETGSHATIGIDLVAMCVNDIVVQGAEPLFFLDYFATGKLDVAAGTEIVDGIAEGCRIAGCALIGGETAEMPGMYHGGDYDLAGFAVGAAERGTLLPRADVAAGDVLVAIASSGVHSNGYSLVRKIVEVSGLAWSAPAPFDAGTDARRRAARRRPAST